jgi:WD40 repeat protein
VIVSSGSTVQIWDTKTRKKLEEIPGLYSMERASSVFTRLSSDKSRAVVAVVAGPEEKWQSLLQVLDVKSHAAVLDEHYNSQITDIDISGDARRVLVAFSNGDVKVINAECAACINVGHRYIVDRVVFSPDNRQLLTTVHDNVAAWSIDWGANVGTFINEFRVGERPDAVTFLDNQKAVLAFFGGSARVLYLHTHETTPLPRCGVSPGLSAIAPNGHFIAVLDSEDVRVCETETGKPAAEAKIEDYQSTIKALAVSPTGRQVAIGTDDGVVRIWDVRSDHPVPLPQAQGRNVTSLAFSEDAPRLIVRSEDFAPRVWNIANEVASSSLAATLNGPKERIGTVALSRDGSLALATSTEDQHGVLWLWRVDGAIPLTVIHGVSALNDLAFSQDGQQFAAAWDHTARVWRLFPDVSKASEFLQQLDNSP